MLHDMIAKMQGLWGPISMLMGLLSILSCWYMAFRFYGAWWNPLDGDNGTWIQFGIGIMVMEFLVVHSGGLLAGASASKANTKKQRFGLLTALIVFYFGFAFVLASAFHSKPLFYSFATIMFCRLVTGFFAVSEQNSSAVTQRSVTSALFYMIVLFLSVAIPFPEGGLTNRVLAHFHIERGEAVWNREPQRAMAAGMIYFFLMGVYELFAARANQQKAAATAAAHAEFYGKMGKN
jgi:hypothetical protein